MCVTACFDWNKRSISIHCLCEDEPSIALIAF